MISGFSDHAANERTFLAWVRTGLAVVAFGLVIEKFDLFLRTIAASAMLDAKSMQRLARITGPIGRGEGLAWICCGAALIVLASVRFVRAARLLDDSGEHRVSSVRAELFLSSAVVLLIAVYAIYLAV